MFAVVTFVYWLISMFVDGHKTLVHCSHTSTAHVFKTKNVTAKNYSFYALKRRFLFTYFSDLKVLEVNFSNKIVKGLTEGV